MTEPMSEERLAQLRRGLRCNARPQETWRADFIELLAEVYRLRDALEAAKPAIELAEVYDAHEEYVDRSRGTPRRTSQVRIDRALRAFRASRPLPDKEKDGAR